MKQQRPPRLSWWQRRWQHWLDARHPPGDQHTLSQRSIYILPTRAGWFLGLTLLLLLVASINSDGVLTLKVLASNFSGAPKTPVVASLIEI